MYALFSNFNLKYILDDYLDLSWVESFVTSTYFLAQNMIYFLGTWNLSLLQLVSRHSTSRLLLIIWSCLDDWTPPTKHRNTEGKIWKSRWKCEIITTNGNCDDGSGLKGKFGTRWAMKEERITLILWHSGRFYTSQASSGHVGWFLKVISMVCPL